jgi:type I restriction enzyme, S subunit
MSTTTKTPTAVDISIDAESDQPEGWVVARLGDIVVDAHPGFACGVNNREKQGIGHLRPMNVNTDGQIALTDLKYVPESRCGREERLVRKGDVLFNNTNSTELVGKTAYYGYSESRAFSNHMTRLRCWPEIFDPRFGALALHQRWRQGFFKSVCNQHVSQSSVSRTVLLETEVALPPFPNSNASSPKSKSFSNRSTPVATVSPKSPKSSRASANPSSLPPAPAA